MKSCFKLPEFVVDTFVMEKICKYHKRKGQEYRSNDLVRDFCADAFYVAYPYCLALLYGANRGEFKEGKVCLSCPNPGGIIFEVERINHLPFYQRAIKKIFEWIVAKVLYPLDRENWHIRLKVIENKGKCPAGFTMGREYWFNIRRLDELCPASFYTIYPFVLSYLHGHNLPWQEEESAKVHCPDHKGIIYQLHRD